MDNRRLIAQLALLEMRTHVWLFIHWSFSACTQVFIPKRVGNHSYKVVYKHKRHHLQQQTIVHKHQVYEEHEA